MIFIFEFYLHKNFQSKQILINLYHFIFIIYLYICIFNYITNIFYFLWNKK